MPEAVKRGSSIENLLLTKLEVPFIRSKIVSRPRLTNSLKKIIERQVALIAAPTGYGKTTLIAEWLSTPLPTCWHPLWVNLDPTDNDPRRLFAYLEMALGRVSHHFMTVRQEDIQGEDEASLARWLTAWINAISESSSKICIIFDHFEAITNPSILDGFGFLIEHQPKNLHLVLSSRTNPPLPFTWLRAHGQLVEITARDLAFTLSEIKSYILQEQGLGISDEEMIALHHVTEGWIGGLQLAADSLRKRNEANPMIQNPVVLNRQIYDYLTAECIDRVDPEIKDFLLKTSILTEFCVPLCDTFLGRQDSRKVIHQVLQQNLFITPLNEQQTWFRYHTLFRETLRIHLEENAPEIMRDLHTRAYQWSLQNEYFETAISHALAAGDLIVAADVMEKIMNKIIGGTGIDRLNQWSNYFSEDLLSVHPRLGIYYAMMSYLQGNIDQVESKLAMLEKILRNYRLETLSTEERDVLWWEISAFRSMIKNFKGDYTQEIPRLKQMLGNVPETDVYFLGLLYGSLAETSGVVGDFPTAVDAYTRSLQSIKEHQLGHAETYAISEQALFYKGMGKLSHAEQIYNDILHDPSASQLNIEEFMFAKSGLAEIAIERNDFATAGQVIKEVIANQDALDLHTGVCIRHEWIPLRLARFYLACGDLSRANQYMEKALHGFQKNRNAINFLPTALIDLKVRLWFAIHSPHESPDSLLNEVRQLNTQNKSPLAEQTALARVYLAQGDSSSALALLESIESFTRKINANERLMEILILKSLIYRGNGLSDLALQNLGEAFGLAKPEGYIRCFIAEGEALKPAISEYLDRSAFLGEEPAAFLPFAKKIYFAFQNSPGNPFQPESHSESKIQAVSPVLNQLSQRELELVKLLIDGKSLKEAAGLLKISTNTVKTHIKRIYKKLGIHSQLDLVNFTRD
jgi:LuxR family maltose regulon positive regulatory protein